MRDPTLAESKATSYRLFVLCVSILSLIIISAMMFLPLSREAFRLLAIWDVLLCTVFLFDFLRQFHKAESKWKYMVTWGWLDLIACIPNIDALRWGRAARIARLAQMIRGLRAIRHTLRILGHYRRRSAAGVTGVVVFLSLIIGSMGMLHFELESPDSNIRSAEDALWWAWVTVTTVGYGDYAPVTRGGRIVASVLMVVGVGLFSSLSGLIASWLLESKNED